MHRVLCVCVCVYIYIYCTLHKMLAHANYIKNRWLVPWAVGRRAGGIMKDRRKLLGVMKYVLIFLIVAMIPGFIYVETYGVVQFKYMQFVYVNYTSVTLRKKTHQKSALAGVAQWVEGRPVTQRVASSIPSQGT